MALGSETRLLYHVVPLTGAKKVKIDRQNSASSLISSVDGLVVSGRASRGASRVASTPVDIAAARIVGPSISTRSRSPR